MTWRGWLDDRRRQKIRRDVLEHNPFIDADSMRLAFQPLSETTITWDDLSICWACGHLFLTSMEGVHVARHDWQRQTNPIGVARPIEMKWTAK